MSPRVRLICSTLAGMALGTHSWAQKSGQEFHPVIPKTWDEAAMAMLEVPLADPVGSPKHVSADYYYKMPVRPIYKEYPIYAPDREPSEDMNAFFKARLGGSSWRNRRLS